MVTKCNAKSRGKIVAGNRDSTAGINPGKPRTEDKMMMEKEPNTQSSLAASVPIALTEDSQDTSTEEQSGETTIKKSPLKEIQKSMESPPAEGGLKEERYKYNNISMSDSELHTIIPPHIHLKNV